MTAPSLLRFYFHVEGSGRDHRDDEGEVFATAQAAESHAIQIARELRHDNYRDCVICVTDADGLVVARVPIGGAAN